MDRDTYVCKLERRINKTLVKFTFKIYQYHLVLFHLVPRGIVTKPLYHIKDALSRVPPLPIVAIDLERLTRVCHKFLDRCT